MKFLLLLIICSINLWAKPVVVMSYYDKYGNGSFNNSERVALSVEKNLNKNESSFIIHLCKLNTIFDQAYSQLDNCIKTLPQVPLLVLGLGEAGCDLKVETMVRNYDYTYGPDNVGNERSATEIIPGAAEYLGLKYPLPQMYCAIDSKDRKQIEISNDAGSFVCNNTAFQLGLNEPQIPSGFIHVPANHCRKLDDKTKEAVSLIEKMLVSAVNSLTQDPALDIVRLPTTLEEILEMKELSSDDYCMKEFYSRTKAAGVKRRGLGRFLFRNN